MHINTTTLGKRSWHLNMTLYVWQGIMAFKDLHLAGGHDI